jgi:hypothetical protein
VAGAVGQPTTSPGRRWTFGEGDLPRRFPGCRCLTLTGQLRRATPKTIRYRLLHGAGRVTPRRLDLDHRWPWTPALTAALHRLHTLLPPHTVTNQALA